MVVNKQKDPNLVIIKKLAQQCQSGTHLILNGDMLNYSFQQKNLSCMQFDGRSKNQGLSIRFHDSVLCTVTQLLLAGFTPDHNIISVTNIKNQLFDLSSNEPYAQLTFVCTCNASVYNSKYKRDECSCILLHGILREEKQMFIHCKMQKKSQMQSQKSALIFSV